MLESVHAACPNERQPEHRWMRQGAHDRLQCLELRQDSLTLSQSERGSSSRIGCCLLDRGVDRGRVGMNGLPLDNVSYIILKRQARSPGQRADCLQ